MWFVMDSSLILPEYYIEFDYEMQTTPYVDYWILNQNICKTIT